MWTRCWRGMRGIFPSMGADYFTIHRTDAAFTRPAG